MRQKFSRVDPVFYTAERSTGGRPARLVLTEAGNVKSFQVATGGDYPGITAAHLKALLLAGSGIRQQCLEYESGDIRQGMYQLTVPVSRLLDRYPMESDRYQLVTLAEGCFQRTPLGDEAVAVWQAEAERLLQRIEREQGISRLHADGLLTDNASA